MAPRRSAARSVCLRRASRVTSGLYSVQITLSHHLEGLEELVNVGTWLTRIAVNCALSRSRRSQRFDALDGEANQKEGGSHPSRIQTTRPEGRASCRELQSGLTAAIDCLSQELRTMFVLRETEGLSTLETSEALQLSSEAVRVRFHRAPDGLRKAVEKQVARKCRDCSPLPERAATERSRSLAYQHRNERHQR